MNQFGIRLVALLNDVSVWWHILGVLIIVAVLAFVPSKHASTTYVFTNIVNNTGWHSTFYVLLLGLLLAQYTFTGYDASAHMTEETHERVTQRAPWHRDVDPGVADRRLGAADRDHVRDPGDALHALHQRAGAAGPDLRHRDRGDRRQAAAAGHHRSAAVLRDVLGHRELADDLRVLPGRRAARLEPLAPGEQADQDADQRDLAGGRRGADPGPAVPVEQRGLRRGHLDRGHRPVHRVRRADLPAAAAGGELQARALAPGPVELPGRHDRGDLGGLHHDLVHAAHREPDQPGATSTTPSWPCSWCSASPASTGLVSAKNWFTGPKVQGSPEELAAIERELST